MATVDLLSRPGCERPRKDTTMRNTQKWLLTAALLAAVACGVEIGIHHAPGAEAPIFAEHRPLKAGSPSQHLGESCDAGGESECFSRLCLHVSSDRNAGYFCSRGCTNTYDCPADWSCAQIYPSADASACVPPRGWVSKLAATRSAPRRE